MTIEVANLVTGYGGMVVLRDVSLRVGTSEILGVLGRNGMGKTTLMRCLSGLLPAISGQIRLDNVDLTGLKPHQRARMGVSTVPQDAGMFRQLTVRENLELGKLVSGTQRDRTDEVLAYFPRLGERLDQAAETLSGGEQRMLAIGRALMANPKVLLLDEPSDGVMPLLVKQIVQNLIEINDREHITIIIVEQNVPMVFDMTDHCVLLEKGRIVAEGTRAEISRTDVMKQYLAL
jgi:ABC-type branched-subunit amino acid transport system ATPase component